MEQAKEPKHYSPTVIALYILSLAAGTTASLFFLKNEVEQDNDLASRTIYSFIFLAAGMLFSIAKTASAAQNPSYDQDEPFSPASPGNPMPESPRRFYNTDGESRASIFQSPQSEIKQPFLNRVNSDLSPLPTSRHSTSRLPQIIEETPTISAWRSRAETCLSLTPTIWLAQSLSLFIQNIMVESNTSNQHFQMPYSTLTGLTSGFLFNLSIKPWPLYGLRDSITFYRNNVLLALEYFARNLLRDNPYEQTLVASITASFWTGYNFFELTKKLTNYAVLSSQLAPQASQRVPKQSLLYTAASLFGFSLMGTSIGILKLVPEDEGQLRNFFSLWLACIAGYIAGYPIGRALSPYMPERFHRKALTLLTYLLIPLASPQLTSIHLGLLIGAGICGGAAQSILNTDYAAELRRMTARKTEIDQLLARLGNPDLIEYLRSLPLVDDESFLTEVTKHRRTKLSFNIICGLYTAYTAFLAIAQMPNYGKNGETNAFWRPAISTVTMTMMLLTFNKGLPRFMPSIYSPQALSQIKNFFYLDSFNLIFFAKIAFAMGYNKSFLGNAAETYNVLLFDLIVLTFLAKGVHKRFNGGYKPYVPSNEDMAQAKILLHNQALTSWISNNQNQIFPLNYHLLKFMRENCLPEVTLNADQRQEFPSTRIVVEVEDLQAAVPLEESPPPPPSPQTEDRHLIVATPAIDKQQRPMYGRLFTIRHAPDEYYLASRFDTGPDERAGDAGIRGTQNMQGLDALLQPFKI